MRDSKRDTDVYNSLLDSAGEVGMVWENGIEMCSGLVHWNDPEGWDGVGGGRGFRMGNTCTPMADSCQCTTKPIQYCKVISFQLKLINVYIF